MLVNEIKTKYPDYKSLACNDFNRQHDLWGRPMYQGNPVFQCLKQTYGDATEGKVTTRQQIIDLFKDEKYYEGYLCALVWGNIGTYPGGRTRFEEAFSTSQKEVAAKIVRIRAMIENNNLEEAFDSMLPGGQNTLPGLGVSFFTKILYFVGATVNCNVKPLIFDVTSLKICERLYKDAGVLKTARQTKKHYIWFCTKMKGLSALLGLPTPGHLEAFLFNSGNSLTGANKVTPLPPPIANPQVNVSIKVYDGKRADNYGKTFQILNNAQAFKQTVTGVCVEYRDKSYPATLGAYKANTLRGKDSIKTLIENNHWQPGKTFQCVFTISPDGTHVYRIL